mmetsp:Transcript_10052/g.13055  ORF Transcript_10052/g.13055 Transcript_10052/m.13055 type:complete len:416 (-) Transcript_10052:414-1661(-)|eukprot:CAMPEP_0204840142 /NCGR_PEP_ID=MMETSP1346-20131115/36578_1 /ASSEMBLY_ACC=CAM_ASM_000771 /TAXON_ID=215587 /ORGANISM="Aplanochytrium stocchinoi, Strain GSBS06" /LENGTH=415 /DNA_ID=CAMNT_0051977363 /DNA_START=131 /DNA_END=1378 /DNA_ORIENTATION=-
MEGVQEVTAPDGSQFTDLKSYRKHIFNNYFCFKGKTGEKLEKFPGEVDGQDFHLSDLTDCEVLVLDNLDRAVVSGLKRCKIFIGPCMESVVMRNLQDCEITIACKELRLNDSSNCTIHAFTTMGVFLETCHGIKVGKFNGAYSGLTYQFQAAKLSPSSDIPKVTDFSIKDESLPLPHFELLPDEITLANNWDVELHGSTGPPENPVFPDVTVEPQPPPPPINPPPEMNPVFADLQTQNQVENETAETMEAPADNDVAEYDFIDEANTSPNPIPNAEIPLNPAASTQEEIPNGIVEESSALAEWKKKFEELCQQKDKSNEEKRNQMREEADEELEAHYEQRTNTSAARFSSNREQEKELLKDIQDKLDASTGNPWERTMSLIDIQAEADGADKTRMRNLLIQLKSSSNPALFNGSD